MEWSPSPHLPALLRPGAWEGTSVKDERVRVRVHLHGRRVGAMLSGEGKSLAPVGSPGRGGEGGLLTQGREPRASPERTGARPLRAELKEDVQLISQS